MALIECDECGARVSDKASACVKCGAPLNTGWVPLARADGTAMTTQQTGKKYKGAQVVGVAMICAGVVSCTAKEPIVASGLLMVGLLVYLGARIGAWWNHG
jgi:hypothetical protein